jgi:hypothetical protein
MNDTELYEKCIINWGIVAQLDQCIEEAAELIVSINKWKRSGLASFSTYCIDAIIDEIVDNEIMLGQLCVILNHRDPDFKEKIVEQRNYKRDRLKFRVEK